MTRFRSRIKALEMELKAQSPPALAVVSMLFGESQETAKARYCEERGISPEAERDWIFVNSFADPSYVPPAAEPLPPEESRDSNRVEIARIMGQLKAEGLSEQEILAAVYAESLPEEDPPDESLSPECLEERRRLEQMWARREPRGQGFLRPVEALRHDDLTALFTKKQRPH